MNIQKTKKAFTLIELLVVIGIIALLVGMGSVYYTTSQKKARDSKRRADLKQLQTSLELYRQDQNPPSFPATLSTACGASFENATTGVVYMSKMVCETKDVTPVAYAYSNVSALTYKACACLESPGNGDITDCTGCGALAGAGCASAKCVVVTPD